MKAKSKILVGAAVLAMGSTAAFAATTINLFDSSSFESGTPGTSSGVVVTATVQPTLAMEISTGAIALGDLSTSAPTTGSIGIEVGTNARNGVTVTAASANAGLASTTASHTIKQNATLVGEGYTFASALGTTDSAVAGTQGNLTTAQIINSTPVAIYSNTKPEKLANGTPDATFTVGAQIDAETPAASDYTDTITFTVTGSY